MCDEIMLRKAENAKQKMSSGSRNSWMFILLRFITRIYLYVFFECTKHDIIFKNVNMSKDGGAKQC